MAKGSTGSTDFGGAITTFGTQVRIDSQTSAYTATENDDVILASGTITITLPSASIPGIKLMIVNTGAGTITVSRAGSDTIEGSTTVSLTSQYEKVGLVSNGTSTWYNLNTAISILSSANTWSAAQTFDGGIITQGTAVRISSKTTAYTATSTDDIISCDATSAAFTVTLPSATGSGRKLMVIKKDSSANAITVSRAGTDTIEGSTTKSISSQYGKLGLVDLASGLWADLSTGGGI